LPGERRKTKWGGEAQCGCLGKLEPLHVDLIHQFDELGEEAVEPVFDELACHLCDLIRNCSADHARLGSTASTVTFSINRLAAACHSSTAAALFGDGGEST
jgi:hypothetical protein